MIAPRIRLVIEKELKAGAMVTAIARKYDLDNSTVSHIRKRIGVPGRDGNGKPAESFSRADILRWVVGLQDKVFGQRESRA